jgi:pyrimidine-nucleoside phosphorylase
LLVLGGKASHEDDARQMAESALKDGRAWQKFRALVTAQGGDVAYVDDPTRLPVARLIETVPAPRSGYLSGMNARVVGEAAVFLGGGRAKKEDTIDHAVGIIVHHKVGDRVEAGQPLFTIHANDEPRMAQARQQLLDAHTWSDVPVKPLPLFYGVIRQ